MENMTQTDCPTTVNDSGCCQQPSQQQGNGGASSTLLKLTWSARGGAAARSARGRRPTMQHQQQHRAAKHTCCTAVTAAAATAATATAAAATAADNSGIGQQANGVRKQQVIQQLLEDADEREDFFMTGLSFDEEGSTKLWTGEFEGGAVSHPTLQDISVSSLLQQQVPFDETAMMHSGFYGSREEVEKLLTQAIQMRCRTKAGNRLLSTPAEWSSLEASPPKPLPPSSLHQQNSVASRQQAAPNLHALSSSVRSLADNLAEAWANSGGASTAAAKSVRFNGEATAAAGAESLTASPQERRMLFMTDFSEEEESLQQENSHSLELQGSSNYHYQQQHNHNQPMSPLFLSARPPMPKPRASQQPGTAAASAVEGEAPPSVDSQPVPVPMPRTRRYPQLTAALAAAAAEPAPMPKPRRSLVPCLNTNAAFSVTANTSDYNDNSTVRPDHVGSVLEGLLQARIQLTRPPGASNADAVFASDVQSSLTTERRPMDTGLRVLAAGPSASAFASNPVTAVAAAAGNKRMAAPASRYAR